MSKSQTNLGGRPPTHTAPTTLLDKVRQGQLDGRTRPAKAYKQAEAVLLAHVQKTTGADPSPLAAVLCAQCAWLVVVCSLFTEAALAKPDALASDGLPLPLVGERYFTALGKLDKLITSLAKLCGTSPARMQDGFADALDSLKVAVPVGQAQATTTPKPKRAKAGAQ